jgi:hypothetical protein
MGQRIAIAIVVTDNHGGSGRAASGKENAAGTIPRRFPRDAGAMRPSSGRRRGEPHRPADDRIGPITDVQAAGAGAPATRSDVFQRARVPELRFLNLGRGASERTGINDAGGGGIYFHDRRCYRLLQLVQFHRDGFKLLDIGAW